MVSHVVCEAVSKLAANLCTTSGLELPGSPFLAAKELLAGQLVSGCRLFFLLDIHSGRQDSTVSTHCHVNKIWRLGFLLAPEASRPYEEHGLHFLVVAGTYS